MVAMSSSKLRKRIRIERPIADDSLDGAGSGNFALVAEVRAEVEDALPSRAERMADGVNMAARPARVRIRYREDVKSNMQIVVLRRVNGVDVAERTMQIVSGPAELGNRQWLELMTEDYSTAGNPA